MCGRGAPKHTDCTELCLSRRGIERLAGFGPLVNLEVLWLDGNRLRAITHLDANARLLELYAHVSMRRCRAPWPRARGMHAAGPRQVQAAR